MEQVFSKGVEIQRIGTAAVLAFACFLEIHRQACLAGAVVGVEQDKVLPATVQVVVQTLDKSVYG